MSQPFEVGDLKTNTQSAIIIDGSRFAGFGIDLPERAGEQPQSVADLLERRLSRLEQALGLDPICGH